MSTVDVSTITTIADIVRTHAARRPDAPALEIDGRSVSFPELVKAIVVRAPGGDVSGDDIVAFARERLAGFKLPKSVDFIDELPRNPSGKILKRQLREPYWADAERRVG